MTFNKPPEWGARFHFPENAKASVDGLKLTVTEKLACEFAEKYDSFIAEEIAREARAAGVSDLTVLNKSAILAAIQKQVPQKPERTVFHDDELWKEAILRCPRCAQHLLVVEVVARPDHGFVRLKQEDKSPFCRFCGQAIDWRITDA